MSRSRWHLKRSGFLGYNALYIFLFFYFADQQNKRQEKDDSDDENQQTPDETNLEDPGDEGIYILQLISIVSK